MNRWKKFFLPPDRRHPWQLAADNLRLKNSPFGERYNPDLTPWVKEPLEIFPDNRVKEITCVCCVQGGKTQTMQVAAWWAMKHQPAPLMFNLQTNEDAMDFAKERFNPMIDSDPVLYAKLPTDFQKRTICKLSLVDMFVLIQGANLTNLQSKNCRWIFNDELAFWKARGLLDHARKRATQYWNRRIFNASTAGEAASELDYAFQDGDCREWHLACPECGKLNRPKWERIVFPKFEGAPDFERIKAETRFVCEHCAAAIEHTEATHKVMNAGGKYVAMNPRPKPGHVSFTWNALCLNPAVLSWGDLAVEFASAMLAYDAGYEEPLREFKNKRLAEFWNPSVAYAQKAALPTSDYSSADVWEKKAAVRFMGVDMQKDHFWFVVRDFAEDSTSRLVEFGRLLTWDHVREKQLALKVADACTIIDSGHWADEVYEACCNFGWRTMKGEDDRGFPWSNGKTTDYRPYSTPREMTPGMGRPNVPRRFRTATLLRWSNPTIKNFLWRLQTGSGIYWGVPKDVDPLYIFQLNGEVLKTIVSKKTGKTEKRWMPVGRKGEHARDCECMVLTAAMVYGLFAGVIQPVNLAEVAAED